MGVFLDIKNRELISDEKISELKSFYLSNKGVEPDYYTIGQTPPWPPKTNLYHFILYDFNQKIVKEFFSKKPIL